MDEGAITQGLPIGSGEIESAHHYFQQKAQTARWQATTAATIVTLDIKRASDE